MKLNGHTYFRAYRLTKLDPYTTRHVEYWPVYKDQKLVAEFPTRKRAETYIEERK
jgi:hypothetical protein